MRWPVQMQLLVPMLSVVILTIALASGALAWLRLRQVRGQEEESFRRLTATLADASFPLSQRVLQQMSGLSGAEFVLFEASGNLECATLHLEAADLQSLLGVREETGAASFASGTPLQLGGRSFLVTRVPVVRRMASGEPGKLVVLYPEDRSAAAVQQAVYPALLAGAVMVAVVVLASAVLARRLVRPIQQLGRQAAAIAAGDFTPVAVGTRNDEIRDLAVALDSMAAKLSRYEDQVRRSERLRTLDQLGAGMAHQLRNAATGALMAIELHQRRCPEGEAGESLQVALRQLRLMESYLQRFLTLGRGQPVPHEDVCLARLVDEAVELVRPACAHAGITLTVSAQPEPLRVRGDPESLRQLLVNLLLNAAEAAGTHDCRPAKVAVTLRRQGADRAVVEVSDSGPGPAQAVQARLCEPFVSDKPDGTGLGLYVARQIVDAHQGSLTWRRSDDGMTCFAVELPLAQGIG